METHAKIIVVTLLFSLIVATIHQREDLGIIGELIIIAYFLGLFFYTHFRRTAKDVYPYFAIVFLLLVMVFSSIKEDVLAVQFAVFFFYTLVSILFSAIVNHFRHEK